MRNSPDNIRKLSTFRNLKDAILFYTDTEKGSLNDFVYKLSIEDFIAALPSTGGGTQTLQQVLDTGNTSTNGIVLNKGLGTISLNPNSITILVDDLMGNLSVIAPSGLFVTSGPNNVGLSANGITFNTSVSTFRDGVSGTVAYLSDIIEAISTEQVENYFDTTNIVMNFETSIVVNKFATLTSAVTTVDLSFYETTGKKITFKHKDPSGTNFTQIFCSNGTTIDESPTIDLTTNNQSVTILFTGFEWVVI